MITLEQAAEFLRGADRVLVLCHQYPDGDTLGSAYALCRALQKLGRQAAVGCSHAPGPRFAFLAEGVERQEFEPQALVAVDVAAPSLLGEPLLSRYGGRVDLCLDHHASSVEFARLTCLQPQAAAAAQLVYRLLPLLGVPLDPFLAGCLYTGLATDTGGFLFPNVTGDVLRMAAELIEAGADAPRLNRLLLAAKSRGYLKLERLALDAMTFFCGGLCAAVSLSWEAVRGCGVREEELEALPALPWQVEGVLAGVTVREKENGDFRVSVRTQPQVNAARICEALGGGGHPTAGGCTLRRPKGENPLARATALAVTAVEEALRRSGLLRGMRKGECCDEQSGLEPGAVPEI